MAQTPSIPKGTRDYSPEIMVKRNYIFDTIKSVFKLYGYMPLETPAMENLSTLMGKYGDEGDKLLFKILNSGDFLSNIPETELAGKNSLKLTNKISEKGLRYDLTVPFARFVVQHQSEISFPFKRYQIQPVWRADRPQKGRYREFYQCDVDVVGSDSLLNEVELIQIVDEVYRRLKLRVRLLINNRKVLAGIAEIIGYPEKLTDITVAIDKMDKIGIDNVNAELREKGLTEEAILKLQPILNLEGDTKEKLQQLRTILQNSPTGLKGIKELTQVFSYLNEMPLQTEIKLDLTLARGLSYYTGAIFEVKALDAEMGSITGGGRYDDLTGIFGLKNVSGVGISFGADRIFDVMTQLDLFTEDANTTTRILFVNFGEKEECFCLPLLRQLRNEGINAEIYPEAAKMKKQMTYADRKKIPFVALVGENEIKEGTVSLKNMSTGEQANIKTGELAVHLK
ncbi:histidine--tRNA ligase [Bacteroides acidifaciens]|uniref:histidine--tRNA ligase n=1 Tax=Bacteroides acidifaciens TaxID=85831 RepID=UPI00258C35E5|nr:histidine--tRNA ligase [Bacteroides acidifaciens]